MAPIMCKCFIAINFELWIVNIQKLFSQSLKYRPRVWWRSPSQRTAAETPNKPFRAKVVLVGMAEALLHGPARKGTENKVTYKLLN